MADLADTTASVDTETAALDALSDVDVAELLRPACASPAWLAAVLAGRPYPDLDALRTGSDQTLAALPWSEIEAALAAHPRIGERAGGADREAAFSREEQAGAATEDADVLAALHRGNVAYEQRFGQVFLICATGRSPAQILAALHERMDNDQGTERDVVRRELSAIVRLRLTRILSGMTA